MISRNLNIWCPCSTSYKTVNVQLLHSQLFFLIKLIGSADFLFIHKITKENQNTEDNVGAWLDDGGSSQGTSYYLRNNLTSQEQSTSAKAVVTLSFTTEPFSAPIFIQYIW